MTSENNTWISRCEEWEKFLIRRDPRNINRIWVPEPGGEAHREVPYQTLSNLAVRVVLQTLGGEP